MIAKNEFNKPIGLRTDLRSFFSAMGRTQIVSGNIDLAFRGPDGWVIADYKTDTVNGNLQRLINCYRPQVEMYKKFREEMSRERVKETGLFFTDTFLLQFKKGIAAKFV